MQGKIESNLLHMNLLAIFCDTCMYTHLYEKMLGIVKQISAFKYI